MTRFLLFCAKNSRTVLALSLVAGLASLTLAELIKPYIGELVALLLFTVCLRIGPRQSFGALGDIKASLAFTVLLQIALPICAVLIVNALELHTPLAIALILLCAAPALSGSPHLVILLGFDPAPALRQVIIGTALLPLTILPAFALLPNASDIGDVSGAAFRLLTIIGLAAAAGFSIRATLMKAPDEQALKQIDGASTLLLAIVVVGLMAAIHGEMKSDPLNVALTLGVATAANFSLQIVTALSLMRSPAAAYTVPIGVIAGNRNIALFLTVLPVQTITPLLLFIACYQIPMYLTPILMRPFYRRIAGAR